MRFYRDAAGGAHPRPKIDELLGDILAYEQRAIRHLGNMNADQFAADEKTLGVAPHSDTLQALWADRSQRFDNPGEAQQLAATLQPVLASATMDVLHRLYPAAHNSTP